MVRKLIGQIDTRTRHQYKNIALSILYKGISVLNSFLLVKISVKYLTIENYGVWLTINSIVGWTALFDLGLGNGLKNKISELLSKGNTAEIKKLVSTGYATLFIIVVFLLLIFSLTSPFADWNNLLNYHNSSIDIDLLVYVSFAIFIFRLLLDLINSVLLAHQKVAFVNLIGTISSSLTLIVVHFSLEHITHQEDRLFFIGYSVSLIPLLVSAFYNLYLFKSDFQKIRPTFRLFDKKYVKDIGQLGGQFFIIQISVLIIFSTDNILISRIFDTEQVAIYNICYKLFSGFTIIWGIIIAPYWIAFNEAFIKQDFDWIKLTKKRLVKFWIVLNLGMLMILPFIDNLYKIWIGPDILIPISLSLSMALFISISTYSSIFGNIVNGIGKVRLQLFTSMTAALINIPLAIFLSKYLAMGLNGIIFASSISLSLGATLCSIQVSKIIKGSQSGIWNK